MDGRRRQGSDGIMLLCLDTVGLAADSDAEPRPSDAAWRANAAGLLGHARALGWSIGHVISRRPRPGEAPWRPMAGLAPGPSEPVYHRDQPSAFSSPELHAVLAGGSQREVVLCGVSVRGSALATALDALRLTRRLTLVADAAWLPPMEREGVDGLLQLQRSGLAANVVRLASTEALLRPWSPLRLVQGGRA
jgi:nicotinamidase-related amidase